MIFVWYIFLFFFFQAEDGIRDLVRSRGLGDVYKRQLMNISLTARHFEASQNLKDFCTDSVDKLTLFYDRIVSCDIILEPTPSDKAPQKVDLIIKAVSYTHLTLPTIYSV
eukprot:TRINITY_DN16410_c0_g1_i1.p1 TRINITY_DN16410_c0_g1~~TRINITY_DN16410_c0_g1_i1.p1  ORF type:complete len:110 (-),score=16.84 TRINITY_DN16410_c0_g1_i1:162-491(-)